MRQLKTSLFYFITLCLLGAITTASIAQELCEAIAREAFENVDKNCAGVDAQNACYGFNTLNATFNSDIVAEGVFENPSDLVELSQIHTVRTSPFNEEEEEWGIGYFQIPVEGSDPVIVMMAGDVIVENTFDSDTGAGNPLENFNFTTGGTSSCRQAPNAVFIQSPKGVPVELTINSTPIRLGSSIVLGTETDETGEPVMWVSVLEGQAEVFPESPQEQVIEQGFYSTVPLSDDNGNDREGDQVLNEALVPVVDKVTGEQVTGPGGKPFYRRVPITSEITEPQPLTEEGEGFTSIESYTFVSEIPETLISYAIELPEIAPTEEVFVPTQAETPDFVVEETLEATPAPLAVGGTCESGDVNWCYAGQPWGDGRCNDPDPNVSAWFWNAGYYNAMQECGLVQEIPSEYVIGASVSAFGGAITQCIDGGFVFDIIIDLVNVPAGTTAIEVSGNFPWRPASYSGGSAAFLNGIDGFELPFTQIRALPSGETGLLSSTIPCP